MRLFAVSLIICLQLGLASPTACIDSHAAVTSGCSGILIQPYLLIAWAVKVSAYKLGRFFSTSVSAMASDERGYAVSD